VGANKVSAHPTRSEQREVRASRFADAYFAACKTWLASAPVKTGEVLRMKEPYGEGVATTPAPSHAPSIVRSGVKR
jgi:hypothetical protein